MISNRFLRRISCGLAASTALVSLVAGPAEAADVASPGSWDGVYGGVHGGVGAFTGMAMDWEFGLFYDPDGDFDQDGFGGLLGVQTGYNYQSGNMVFGIEADWARTGFDLDRTFRRESRYITSEMDWLTTLRARFGLATGNAMAYLTAGLALADVAYCATDDDEEFGSCENGDDSVASEGVTPGLAVGTGVEAAFASNWSLKAEYLYLHMATSGVAYDETPDADMDFSSRVHLARLGLNYHFNGELAAAVEHGGAWHGLYGGVHAGLGAFTGMAMDWDRRPFGDPDGDIDQNGFAGLAGAQVGYNYRAGNAVYGIEADWAWTGYNQDRSLDDDNAYVKSAMNWLATVRGRLGLAAGNAMAYVTAGVGFADLEHCAIRRDMSCSSDEPSSIAWGGVVSGLVAGTGVEAALGGNWSLKGEYLFVKMDQETVRFDPESDEDIDFSNRAHLFRLGINYHLNGIDPEIVEDAAAWKGPYAGIVGGLGAFTGMAIDWHYGIFDDPDGDIDQNGSAGVLGAQAGFNHQHGNVVYGVEGDWSLTNYSQGKSYDNVAGEDEFYIKAQMNWLATLRGRLGVASGGTMAYVTAGLALADLEHCANDGDGNLKPCSNDGVQNVSWHGVLPGLAAGAGVETALGEDWSLKGEYLFVKMDTENVVYNTERDRDIDFSNRAHLLRFGLNYQF